MFPYREYFFNFSFLYTILNFQIFLFSFFDFEISLLLQQVCCCCWYCVYIATSFSRRRLTVAPFGALAFQIISSRRETFVIRLSKPVEQLQAAAGSHRGSIFIIWSREGSRIKGGKKKKERNVIIYIGNIKRIKRNR